MFYAVIFDVNGRPGYVEVTQHHFDVNDQLLQVLLLTLSGHEIWRQIIVHISVVWSAIVKTKKLVPLICPLDCHHKYST